MLQDDIDEINAPPADLPAADAGLMFQAEPMFLDSEEFLVERQNFRRPHGASGRELTLRMSEDLGEVTGH